MLRVVCIGAVIAGVAGVSAGAGFRPMLRVDEQPRSGQALFVDHADQVTEPSLRTATYTGDSTQFWSWSWAPANPAPTWAEPAPFPEPPSYQPVYTEAPRPDYGPEPAWATAAEGHAVEALAVASEADQGLPEEPSLGPELQPANGDLPLVMVSAEP